MIKLMGTCGLIRSADRARAVARAGLDSKKLTMIRLILLRSNLFFLQLFFNSHDDCRHYSKQPESWWFWLVFRSSINTSRQHKTDSFSQLSEVLSLGEAVRFSSKTWVYIMWVYKQKICLITQVLVGAVCSSFMAFFVLIRSPYLHFPTFERDSSPGEWYWFRQNPYHCVCQYHFWSKTMSSYVSSSSFHFLASLYDDTGRVPCHHPIHSYR